MERYYLRKPITKDQKDSMKIICSDLQKASTQDSEIPLPINEWKELCNYLDWAFSDVKNPPLQYSVPIGYRRNTLKYNFGKGFSIRLPGTFIEDLSAQNSTLLRDGDKSVRITLLEASGKGRLQDAAKLPNIHYIGERTVIDYFVAENRYLASYGKTMDGGQEIFELFGMLITSDTIAMITIHWTDDTETEWAIDLFKQARRERKAS